VIGPLFRRRAAAGPEARWVVLDVESSGLDPARDRLLAIAAVGLRPVGERLEIDLADSFEVVLKSGGGSTVDKANILVHGIGVGQQRSGVAPARALEAFEQWVASAPLAGFHVGFDRALIERAAREALGRAPALRWLDLEPLAAVTHPQVRARALDDWMGHFGIPCARRHEAAADTLATAELLLRLWPRVRAEGATTFDAVARLAASRRWVQV
jgi:DNA polymerase-3 subunit epsilon